MDCRKIEGQFANQVRFFKINFCLVRYYDFDKLPPIAESQKQLQLSIHIKQSDILDLQKPERKRELKCPRYDAYYIVKSMYFGDFFGSTNCSNEGSIYRISKVVTDIYNLMKNNKLKICEHFHQNWTCIHFNRYDLILHQAFRYLNTPS